MTERIYFAHPISFYNTEAERVSVGRIAEYFGISERQVENPNQPQHALDTSVLNLREDQREG